MAGSKPTAVHFSLVFFMMTTLILALVTYLTAKEYQKSAADAKQAKDLASQKQTDFENSYDDIQALKQLLGYEGFEDVGAAGNNENSVVGAARKDLNTYGREQVQPNANTPSVKETIQSLRAALETIEEQAKTYNTGMQEAGARALAEQNAMRNERNQITQSQEQSEQQVQKMVTDQTEKIAEKDREIAKTRQELAAERVAKEQLNDELERLRRTLSEQIALLEKSNQFLRIQLNALEDQSFDKPDGKIVRVDNTTHKVWINLGTADKLRQQVTFSVYTQNHRGVGRGSEDIKAKIEVSKLSDSHLAECRIVQEDFDRPIQEGDPIYSPLFSPGATEYFSFVGILDLDEDGKSDRDIVRDIISNAGAAVELEIDDQGNRTPEGRKLSVKSKFLVIGDIPDPTEFAGFDERQQEIQKIIDEHGALLKESLQQGIKVVTFRDFLNYIGYENKQRLFVAGENRKYNLKSGARSTGTDEVLGANRLSTGQTSERFRTDRGNRGQNTSAGQTSKLFSN